MAFKTQRREKKNVPEFKEPGSQIIERIHKKEISLTEENIKSIKIINSSFWKSLPSDYVYSLNFPQNSQLQKIEAYSFEKLNLYSISLPPSLKFLMPDSMKGCQFLGEVKFNKNDQNQNLLNIICDEALKETAIQSIIIPENVKEIGSRCFPISLSEIEFENGAPKLEIVGNYAFSQINIEFFNMPVNIEPFIEAKNVFYRCKRLNTIRFDYDLYSNQPFLSINYEEEEKEKLKRIQRKEKFKEDIQKMEIFTDINEEYLEMSQDLAKSCLISQVQIQNLEVFISNLNYFYFFNTPKLTSISVQEIEGSKFVKKNGILYTADEKKLIVAERNIKSALISSKCQTISNYAFNVKSLKKVSFEKNSKLKEISFLAFYESQIDSLNISDEVDLIDYGAFYKCKKLEKINIPHSIFLIDFFTFSKTNITNITIPKNVIKIKYGSFCSCTKLTAVTFEKESNLIEIDDYAFAFTNIENILIPKKVIRIGDCCFKDCHNLKLIKFENNANILKIGEQCFLGTKIDESQLKKVLQKIDFSLTKKNTDFYYRKEKINTSISISNPLILSNLTQIFIPADVEEIGFHAFCDIQSLIKVKIINISNSKLKIISDSAFFNCKSLKEFEIPNTVKYFGTNSFKNCKNYSVKINLLSNESVIVGKNAFENSDITSFNSESENIIIDDFAFKSCSTLIEFSAKVKEKLFLGKSTFLNCYSLENVTLSPEIKTIKIGECCFMKSSIVEFIIPNNLTKIPDFCFNCCSNLEKVTINKESKITQFGANAFSRSGIEAIFIPPLTKLIDQKCFEKCKKLKDIEISNLLQKCIINEYAFYMTSVKQINIPKSITRIKSGCFENCEKLENITFSNDSLIKKIEFNSFKSTGIQSIILPSSVKYIDEFSFENCRKLQSVTFLGKNVKISSCAFRECNKLENVTFRSKIKIEPTFCDPVLGYTFYIEFKKEEMNDDILKAFFINKEPAFQSFELINSTYSLIINEKFKSFNFAKKFLSRLVEYKKGNYFSLDRKEIIFTDFVNESITIPKDVEIISSNAFTFTNLKKVDFDKNSNLTTIGKFAFQDLLIEEISIPDTVTTIGESSFYNCKKLKKINITKSSQLQEIGSHAFEKSSIETILFPSTLSIINNFAFFECFNLKKVENNSNSINFKYKSFARSSIEIIQFPSESYFSESSFQECKKLKKLVFLNNPTQLVFENNSFTLSGLKRLKIENAEIHENAFDFCKDLHRISLNGKNIKISKNAINYSSIEMISLTIILNKKLKNQQKYFADIINKILISNIEKFCLIMIINSINSTIYVNHKNYVLNNELIYADMIDNTELTDDNNIKRNEILRVSSNITKINFPTMSHIKKIQWPEKCQVEDLGPSGFFSYYNLIEITIPKNVEKISPHLFEHCHFLKMVDFENQSKLTEISEFAFSNTSIENVNLPKSVKIIKQSAFSYNPKLKTVSFDGEIIEKEAFIYTGITTFKLSNNTKIIESNAFQYCHKLNDFMIDIDNSNLSEIGSFAFAESSIKSINIPPKVKTIQKFTFNGCKNLEKVTFSNNSKLETIEEHSFSGNLSLESINIPKTIINLSYKAFINTPSLKSIMNESNQNFVVMKDNSIYSSDKTLVFVPRNLKRFKINEKCLIIHSGSFCGPKLESVSFSDNSLLFIEECGFAHSTKLKEINIPKSILKIGEEAFIDCQNLEKVKFDALCNLIEIPKFCFAFSGIKSINLPNSIEIINQSSFLYCKDLKNINLIDTNTKYIGYSAFSETSIEKVIFPSSIKYIEDHAFEKTKSLKIVDFTNITNIEIWNKEIPKKYIKRMTKMNKKSIISQNNEQNKVIKKVSNSNPVIIKPNETNLNSTKKNVKKSLSLIKTSQNTICYVKDSAFSNSNVKIFKFNLNEFVWFDFFDKCIKIEEYIVNSNIHLYLSKLFNEILIPPKNKYERLLGSLYKVKKMKWINQDSISYKKHDFFVSPLNFLNTSKLTKIYLGNNINIKCIPKCCFSFTALKQIFITSSVLIIKKSAFKYCYDLEKITFSKKTKLKKIDSFAFYECINLKAISLPNTIDTIPFKCFSFSGLEKMKFPGSIKYVGSMAFFNCKNLNEIVLNEGILELGDLSFSNNNLLKTINIPDSLKTIKPNAFYNCSNLKQLITTPNTKLIEICNGAIENTKIKEIKLNPGATILFEPRNVPYLKKVTFYNEKPVNFVEFDDGTIYEKIKDFSYDFQSKNIDELIELMNRFPINDKIHSISYEIMMKINQEKLKSNENYLKLVFAPKNLECLKINEMCNSIGKSVLNGMKKLTTIEYTNGTTNIINDLNDNCNKINHIKIDGNYSYMYQKIFSNFKYLQKIDISENTNLFYIPKFAFYCCEKLHEIIIPYSCILIEEGAFKNCINLRNVLFGRTTNSKEVKHKLQIIEKEAFYGCKSIKLIVIPPTINKIGESSFMKCEKLKTIEFGILFISKSNKTAIYTSSHSKEKLEIIEKKAFKDCISLVSFRVPQNCSLIEQSAFMNCKSLKSISIKGNKLMTIKYRTFFNCSSLISFKITNLLYRNFDKIEKTNNEDNEEIVNYPFSIEAEAFMNCSSLKEIIIEDNSKNINIKQCISCNHPIVSLDTLKSSSIKKKFRQTIQKSAFCNCASLTKASFFIGNLEQIYENAFLNCSALESIEFNSRYWIYLTSINFDMKSFFKTPKNLKLILVNQNDVVDSIENFVVNEIKEKGKHIFKNHCSSLNKYFLNWTCSDDENK